MAETRLRNEDFRKLLQTPSVRTTEKVLGAPPQIPSTTSGIASGFTHKQVQNAEQKKKKAKKFNAPKEKKEKTEIDELAEESEQRLNEIMNKYRDRAAERRKGEGGGMDLEMRNRISGLRASNDEELDERERRKQEIRESKYLGGDIEHTHLVKGLDYSLLNKTRSEIKVRPQEEVEEEHLKEAFQNPITRSSLIKKLAKTKFAEEVCRVLFEPPVVKRNELFQKGRMAYVVDLEEEQQNDVPVTLLRSTVEVISDKAEQNINVNNMIISKLTDVLSYLRTDGKKKKREKEVMIPEGRSKQPVRDINIYDDIGEYVPDRSSKSRRDDRENRESRHSDNKDSRRREERRDSRRERHRDDKDYDRKDDGNRRRRDQEGRGREPEKRPNSPRHKENTKAAAQKERDPFPSLSGWKNTVAEPVIPEPPKPKKSRLDDDDAYAELFPSSDVFFGAGDDSDEEDFSKMDMGNKKGPVKRWDFETQEDYEKYQNGREALPKAVFQYGVKTNANRKTRKAMADKEDKKVDKELEKIEQIWEQRRKSGKM
ncbi:unnamed protein product [Bursaphelenchus xylophilus]|uniref:(pine wood nematode) hypothetical protein n=1 Tax=Bursaphelenchus xylophilus TaxID=6326 RepID=A0A1I7RH36_BURXY|nr:unnamed protein product [Bursaphelenchus xylophilus]CAG9115989.1 unnamed protein product [Bursaphelenchus xylophilus]